MAVFPRDDRARLADGEHPAAVAVAVVPGKSTAFPIAFRRMENFGKGCLLVPGVERMSEESRLMIRFPRTAIVGFSIPSDAKMFLEQAGLPESAPLLSFSCKEQLQTVAEAFGVEKDETEEEATEFLGLPVIGSDGSGNPICIDCDGRVLIVDHEAGFVEAQVVNSSLQRLVESLVVFETYVQATNGLAPLPSDADAWRQALTNAAMNLQGADPIAYNGFWHSQLAGALTPLGFDMKHMELGSILAAVIAPHNV